MSTADLGDCHANRIGFARAGRSGSVPARFAEQVARHGNRPAVIGPVVWTYNDLAGAAGAVAKAVPGSVTALLLPHGPHMMAAILGTLAAGSAYVPLDPAYPADRLAYMAADCGADAILADRSTMDLALRFAGTRPVVDIGRLDPAPLPEKHIEPDAVAYVLYTSGSTGRPKGVVQNHRNVVFAATNHINNFRLTPDDRVGVLTSFSFDMAVTDTFSALLCGAATVPMDVRAEGPAYLAEALCEYAVTVYHSTPTVYRQLIGALGERRLPAVRAAVLGGEDVTTADVAAFWRHFAPDGVFVNGYGATEISFITQDHLVAVPDGVRVPIGRPLDGIEVLLDGGGPAEGEIVVRSRYLALGYVGRPFAERADGRREYRTGDLARRLADGRLIHLGRADRQVKIRGNRVEPAEVEAALRALSGVDGAAVVARDGELHAYLTGSAAPDLAEVTRALGAQLPAYMVPSTVTVLESLPLTPTGKVDTAALPAHRTPPRTGVCGPRTPTEQAICDAWADELGLPEVGPDENVFALGAHSLRLAAVQVRLERDLGVRIPLARMVEFPTPAALSGFVDRPETPTDDAVADRMARRRAARRAAQ
jgi:amino acid adenylation domain-containing protein